MPRARRRSNSRLPPGEPLHEIHVRLTEAEWHDIERAASAEERSVSNYVRRIALAAARRTGPQEVKHGNPASHLG